MDRGGQLVLFVLILISCVFSTAGGEIFGKLDPFVGGFLLEIAFFRFINRKIFASGGLETNHAGVKYPQIPSPRDFEKRGGQMLLYVLIASSIVQSCTTVP